MIHQPLDVTTVSQQVLVEHMKVLIVIVVVIRGTERKKSEARQWNPAYQARSAAFEAPAKPG